MKSQITSDFVDLFRKLPEHVRETARKNYRLWAQNHAHPSLQFKKVHAVEPLYSARVGIGYRVVGLVDDESITWFWIGAHDEYDKLIDRYR